MERDMDLIRAILMEIEKHEHGFVSSQLTIPDHDAEEIGFHVHLLGQAGLLDTIDITTLVDNSPNALPRSMTWAGYDFLAAAKSDAIWKTATEKFVRTGVGVSLEVLKALLIDLGKSTLGLR